MSQSNRGSVAGEIDMDAFNLFEVPNSTGSPERNLLMGILERAILDYVGNDVREAESARAWLFDELHNPSFDQFTFSWICQQLDLDLFKVARQIRAMPKRGSNRIAPWYFNKGDLNKDRYSDEDLPALKQQMN